MDQLEKLIIENRDEIQNDSPHSGHFERFEMKLNTKRKKPIRLISIISSAAAILLRALFVFGPKQSSNEKFTLGNVSSHYAEVEFYYTSSINKQIESLNALTNTEEFKDQKMKMLLAELNEYDEVYEQLCSDLEATPDDQRVINAMIVYYQSKLEIINRILNELENKKVIIDHENINI